MARKYYSEEFRRDAVELYRVTEGATVAQIAADLGIAHGSLSAWLKAAGVAIHKHGHTAAPPVRPKPLSKRPAGCERGSAILKPNRSDS
jgi:transposase